ncbi:Midasin, partial [Araneus ventricosus]
VYVRPMESNDFLKITEDMYPDIPKPLLFAMIRFNEEIESQVNVKRLWGRQGSPFEFNLRDIFRWCEAIEHSQMEGDFNIGEFVKLIYADRMRTAEDKNKVYMIYHHIMSEDRLPPEHFILHRPLDLNVYEDSVQLGNASIKCAGRNVADTSMISVPSTQLPVLESIMKCIEMNWMPILVSI